MTAFAFVTLWFVGSGYALAEGPKVVGTEPADLAKDVPIGANILVNFDRAMDAKSLTGQTILVNGKPLAEMSAGTALLPDPEGRQAVILMDMKMDSVYEIALTTKIKDQHGNPLSQTHAWKFSTASHIEPLKMPVQDFARFPRMNDRDVPTNVPITTVFRCDLDPATINANTFVVRHNVTNQPVKGKFTVKANRVVFRPDDELKANTTYEVQIAAGVMSAIGTAKERSSSWQFTTGDGPAEGPIVAELWSEDYCDRTQRWGILHAAIENLSKPGKADGKSGTDRAVLAAGQTLKAAIVPLKGVIELPKFSVAGADVPMVPETAAADAAQGPTTVVVAEYNNGGGKGVGNSNGKGKDPEREKIRSAVRAALAKSAIPALRDSGDVTTDGDRQKSDNIYSARFTLDESVPAGPALATFTVVLPDGSHTEPATLPMHIQQQWQPSQDQGR